MSYVTVINKTAHFFHPSYRTQGDDIADNGGIRRSFEAYRDWVNQNGPEKKLVGLDLTSEQLFFLAFGQSFCDQYTRYTLLLLNSLDISAVLSAEIFFDKVQSLDCNSRGWEGGQLPKIFEPIFHPHLTMIVVHSLTLSTHA